MSPIGTLSRSPPPTTADLGIRVKTMSSRQSKSRSILRKSTRMRTAALMAERSPERMQKRLRTREKRGCGRKRREQKDVVDRDHSVCCPFLVDEAKCLGRGGEIMGAREEVGRPAQYEQSPSPAFPAPDGGVLRQSPPIWTSVLLLCKRRNERRW